MSETIVKYIINNIVDNMFNVKKDKEHDICLICHENLDDKLVYKFCCNKYYHEECLVSYIALNQYPKCPICRKWVKKNIKDNCDIIYREYELKNARKKLKLATDYTDDISYFSRTNEEQPLLGNFVNEQGLVSENNTQTPVQTTTYDTFNIFEDLLTIPDTSSNLPNTIRGSLHNLFRNQRNQVSMMQQMFDESWNNFFRQS